MKKRCTAALFLMAFGVTGIATASKARLYDVTTGAVSVLEYKNKWWSGHGPIRGKLSTGETVEGEFTTVPKSDTTWGTIYYGRGAVSGGSTRMSNAQRGSAIVTGGGMVIQCEYVVSALSGHGSGACQDNHGKLYRIMF